MAPLPDEKTTLLTSASTLSFGTDDELDSYRTTRDKSIHASRTFKLYQKRWLVLGSFCILNASNSWICLLWSPLTSSVAEFWNTTESAVDALGGIYMYVFVPTNIFSMWLVVNHLGLAKGLQIGAWLNMVGCFVIYSGRVMEQVSSSFISQYQMVYLGTFICAVGEAFILPMIALLSGSWFSEWERATATSLGTLAFQLGSLVASGSTVVVDFFNEEGTLDSHKIDNYLKCLWLLSLVALALISVNLRQDRPPTPPSEAAAALTEPGKDVSVTYVDSIRMVLRSSSGRSFFCLFGLTVGVYYAVPVFLAQFMPQWTLRDQGVLGASFQISTVLGCLAACRLVSWFHLQYKKIALFLLGGGLLSTIAYLVSVYTQSYIAIPACCGMGFFLSAFMSVGIEFGTALTFPADEAAVYGMLDCTGELLGSLLVWLGAFMSQADNVIAFCGILVGMVAVAFVSLWGLEESIRRPSFQSYASG